MQGELNGGTSTRTKLSHISSNEMKSKAPFVKRRSPINKNMISKWRPHRRRYYSCFVNVVLTSPVTKIRSYYKLNTILVIKK